MQPEPGQFVTPNIRLLKELGRGAMGAVWVARHETLGTDVAVKVMQIAAAQRPDIVERFHREAATTAKLKSPHVGQIFDHGVLPSGMPFLVMELLEGEDLGKYLQRAGTIGAAELAPIVTQLSKALTRAHQSGVVHRDVKPDNVFLSYIDGELLVKVLDFGVAKETNEGDRTNMTSTGTLLGTPLFMSPEQLLSSRSVDHRSDLWATGVLVYKALTGHFPFVGETLGAVSVVVNEGRFERPSSLCADLPPGVDGWMSTALARDPAQRFQSARELAAAFDAVARGEAFVGVVSGPPRNTMPSATNLGAVARAAVATGATAASSGSASASDSLDIPVNHSIGGSTASGVSPTSRPSWVPFALVASSALLVGGAAAIWFMPRATKEPSPGAELLGARSVEVTPASAPTEKPPEPRPTVVQAAKPEGAPSSSSTPAATAQGPKPPPARSAVAPAGTQKPTGVPPKPTADTIGF